MLKRRNRYYAIVEMNSPESEFIARRSSMSSYHGSIQVSKLF